MSQEAAPSCHRLPSVSQELGSFNFYIRGMAGYSSVRALCQLFEIILNICKNLNSSQCGFVMQKHIFIYKMTLQKGLVMISKFKSIFESLLNQEQTIVGWLTQSVKSVKTCHLFVPCDEWLDKKNGKNCSVGLAPPALENVGVLTNHFTFNTPIKNIL